MASMPRQFLTAITLATWILGIPVVASAARSDIPQVGDQAPDATLPNQDGEEVRLSDLWSRAPLVIYFYPADFTPG
jgi:AhpC/TSA family